VNAALSQITAELPRLSGQEKPEVEKEPLDMASYWELIKRLEPMLEMGDPECLKLINDLRRAPNSNGSLLVNDKLIKQILSLDLDEAVVTLAELKKMFN
jgi:hypothetical protein